MTFDSMYSANHYRAAEALDDVTHLLMHYFGMQAEARYLRSRKDVQDRPSSTDLVEPFEPNRMSDRYRFRKKSADDKGDSTATLPHNQGESARLP